MIKDLKDSLTTLKGTEKYQNNSDLSDFITLLSGSTAPTAEQVANALAKFPTKDNEVAVAFANAAGANLKGNGTHSGKEGNDVIINVPGPGYYLIKDEYDGETSDNLNVISKYMLETVGDVTVEDKSDAPTSKKESNKNSAEIGEEITFYLTGTLAADYKNYVGDYKYIFHDTMSSNLDFVYKNNGNTADDLDITIVAHKKGALDNTDDIDISEYADVDITGKKLTVSFDNLKEIEDINAAEWEIVVTYKAKLTSDAVAGAKNTNDMHIEYSNDPYAEEDGTTGTTPDDTEVVTTFEMDITKVEKGTETTIEGVEFELYREIDVEGDEGPGSTKKSKVLVGCDGSDGEYTVSGATTTLVTGTGGKLNVKGLGEGVYYLKETKPKDGYNTIPEIKITVTATYYEENDPKVLSGDKVVGELKELSVSYDPSTSIKNPQVSGGVFSFDLENSKGTNLPSSGGIGTTIFYALGVLLLVGGLSYLVISRRKKSVQ